MIKQSPQQPTIYHDDPQGVSLSCPVTQVVHYAEAGHLKHYISNISSIANQLTEA